MVSGGDVGEGDGCALVGEGCASVAPPGDGNGVGDRLVVVVVVVGEGVGNRVVGVGAGVGERVVVRLVVVGVGDGNARVVVVGVACELSVRKLRGLFSG